MILFYKDINGNAIFVKHVLRNKENKKAFFAMVKKHNRTLYRMKCELKRKT